MQASVLGSPDLRGTELTPDGQSDVPATVERWAEDLSVSDTVWIDNGNHLITSYEPGVDPT